jgi:phenylacetate-coenzyme A ligase PaaK-like adenylate-forming protein
MRQGDLYWLQNLDIDPTGKYRPQEIGELVTGDVGTGCTNRKLAYVFGRNDDGILYNLSMPAELNDVLGKMLFLARYEEIIAYAPVADFKPGIAKRVTKKMTAPVNLAAAASGE